MSGRGQRRILHRSVCRAGGVWQRSRMDHDRIRVARPVLPGRQYWRPVRFHIRLLLSRPGRRTSVNQAELDHIAAGDGLKSKQAERTKFAWSQVVTLLKYRQIVGACLGQFGGNSTMVFFLTWFPTYLATERHMSWLKSGFLPSLPFLAAAVGVLFGGWVSDKLLTVTGSANLAPKPL